MKDQSDYIAHLRSVLEGKEQPDAKDLEVIARLSELSEAPDMDVQRGYDRLRAAIILREREERRKRRLRSLSLGAVAAAVIGVLLVVLLPGRRGTPAGLPSEVMAEQIWEEYVQPDSLRDEYDLRLIRGDGEVLYLRLSDSDSLQMTDMAPLLLPDEEVTLIVPTTRRGTVVLDDGTIVTLNSVSALRLPVTQGDRRHVSLQEGEALMQVAHDETRPFSVVLPEMHLEVLGTTFNVSLYPERRPSATLVEGRLRVTDRMGSSLVLSPGEEAVADAEEGLICRDADLETTTAWVRGDFVFRHLPLSSIMSYIGRWYGFDTSYTDEALQENTYTGALRKEYSRDFVFDLLETTTQLRLNINQEDRHVVVSHR